MRVLLIEDDVMIGESLQAGLRDAGYAVDWVRDGNHAMPALAHEKYDLLLLDIGLPGMDGISILTTLRTMRNPVPVMVITARDALEDRIQGLDIGADDYLVKPFELAELMARMRAVIRRHAGDGMPLLSNGWLTLNPITREVAMASGICHTLTKREYTLLETLLIRPGAILSRSELETRVYGWGEEVESNAIEFLIHSLRKKLGNATIKNIRGVGWMISKNI
ncbi:response regulator transcription factor [Methylovorus sp. MP688]|uniref:response regulator n=1 Tax=Methylovorus sp. (strain MP688) TaxID=887061 RepID=UPI00059D4CFF|nr:response regulator transcription factor [Methylovorus sp. MP688]